MSEMPYFASFLENSILACKSSGTVAFSNSYC